MQPSSRRVFVFAPILTILALSLAVSPLTAQTQTQTQKPAPKPGPAQAKPPQTKPAPAKPAPTAAPVKPAPEPSTPAPPPPQDIRFKSTYTAGELTTETVTFIKGERERFEFQDMVLLKQRDQKRTVQISRAANTYLVAPEGMPAAVAPGAPPKPPGVVMVATTIVDTGERKTAFGQQARHVKVAIDRQPMAGACDATKQRVEIDGWYIDAPGAIASQAGPEAPQNAGGCADEIQSASNGDPKALGFPIAYTSTMTGDDGKPVTAKMEVTEFELTTLDPALFEIPAGLNAAMNVRELSKALSDASEAKLAELNAAPPDTPQPKAPGVVRIGVPEFSNKTSQAVDTRALRHRLIGDLSQLKIEAVPMPAATPAELQTRAQALGYDYVLMAEVVDLKVSKPGAFGGLMKAATGVAGGPGGSPNKDNTESTIAVKLVQPDGKPRLQTTSKGKDGSGFSLQTGLGLAKFAGGMYVTMFAGPQMMSRLYGYGAGNLGGLGLLGNPMLYQMQASSLGGFGKGAGLDATAGAASYLMQQAMTMNQLGGLVGVPGVGPSYDESLSEAVQNAAKAVQKAIQQK